MIKKNKKKKSLTKTQEKRFFDEEILRNLEANGFKRKIKSYNVFNRDIDGKKIKHRKKSKKKKKIEKIVQLNNIPVENVIPQQNVEMQKKPSFLDKIVPFFKGKEKINKEVIPETKEETPVENVIPQQNVEMQKKPSFLDKIVPFFKGKEKINKEVIPETKEEIANKQEIKEIVTEVNGERTEGKEKPIQEQKQSEVLSDFEEKDSTTEVEQTPSPEIKIEPIEEIEQKKEGFFTKLERKMGIKKAELNDLEPIKIITPAEELKEIQNVSSVHVDNVEEQSISNILKQKINPQSQKKQESNTEKSSLDILYHDKKKIQQ